MPKLSSGTQADWHSKRATSHRQFLKRQKSRSERRRAKRDPETLPGYGRYTGWQS